VRIDVLAHGLRLAPLRNALNGFAQYRTEIEGLDFHFLQFACGSWSLPACAPRSEDIKLSCRAQYDGLRSNSARAVHFAVIPAGRSIGKTRKTWIADHRSTRRIASLTPKEASRGVELRECPTWRPPKVRR